MARLDGVDDKQAGAFARIAFSGAKRMVGKVPEPMRIMAHNTWVLSANSGFELAMGRARSVEGKLKTLASIKVSSLVGCVF